MPGPRVHSFALNVLVRALVVSLALSCGACSLGAIARGDGINAGATLAYDVSYKRSFEGDAVVGGVATGGLKARAFAGTSGAAPAFGFDLALGGAHPRGFAWRGAGYPLGLGTRLGRRGVAGVVAGLGASGVTGRVAASLETPVEAFTTVRVGDRTALSLWIQPAWLPFSDTRADGAPDLAFVDELRAGLTVRIGRASDRWRIHGGDGYHLGALYTEEYGARFIGVTVGYDVDLAAD